MKDSCHLVQQLSFKKIYICISQKWFIKQTYGLYIYIILNDFNKMIIDHDVMYNLNYSQNIVILVKIAN